MSWHLAVVWVPEVLLLPLPACLLPMGSVVPIQAVATVPAPCRLQGFLLSHVFLARAPLTFPFCVVLGKLARSTQSAASPGLNQWSGIWDLFVSYCPARQCWASPLGACAILPPICERGLALLTSLVKGFSYMDKSWALEVFVTRSFEMTALPSPTLQAVLLSRPKTLLQDVVGTGCVESRGVFLLQGGITWSRSWWTCKMLWPSQICSALFVLECRMGSWSSWAPLGS